MAEKRQIQFSLIKSTIGVKPKQRRTAVALGLTKIGKVVEKPDTPVVRGMLKRISHLIQIKES